MWGRSAAAAARFLRVPQPSPGQAQTEQASRWARALPERIWRGETASSSMVGVSKARQPSVARSSTLLRYAASWVAKAGSTAPGMPLMEREGRRGGWPWAGARRAAAASQRSS